MSPLGVVDTADIRLESLPPATPRIHTRRNYLYEYDFGGDEEGGREGGTGRWREWQHVGRLTLVTGVFTCTHLFI